MNHRIFRSSPLPPPKLKAWPIGALRYFNLWNPSPSQFKTIKRSWPICKKHAPVSVNSNITIEGHCRVDVLMVFFMKILLEGITTTWASSSNFSVLDYLPCDYLKENFFFFINRPHTLEELEFGRTSPLCPSRRANIRPKT